METVKRHMKAVLSKLDASTRTQAAAHAQMRGLVERLRAHPAVSARSSHVDFGSSDCCSAARTDLGATIA